MWAGARRSVCALGVSVALTAGVVSVPPALKPQVAVGQVYVSDVALAATSSPVASSAVDDLEVLRDRIDRAIRTGLYILSLPVTFPILMLGLAEVYGCLDSFSCGTSTPPIFDLALKLANFFSPPTGAAASVDAASEVALRPAKPVASSVVDDLEALRDRVGWVIGNVLAAIELPVVVPLLYVSILTAFACGGGARCGPGAKLLLDVSGLIFNLAARLVNVFTPVTTAPLAASLQTSSASAPSAASVPRPLVAGSARAQTTATHRGSQHSVEPVAQVSAKKAAVEKVGARTDSEHRSGRGHSARIAH